MLYVSKHLRVSGSRNGQIFFNRFAYEYTYRYDIFMDIPVPRMNKNDELIPEGLIAAKKTAELKHNNHINHQSRYRVPYTRHGY